MNVDLWMRNLGIGKRIQELRISNGWRVSDLARKSGITPPNIGHLEKNTQSIRLSSAIKLARAFNLTLDELIFNTSRHIRDSEKILELYVKLSEDDKEMVERIIMRMLND